ncbi:MAG: hypothetical protein IJO60_05790 [Agathobacter sp.]|nr:hypothetical protein [Agathobacter sp.]
MEYFGIFAFILVLAYSSYPGKVKHLEAVVKRLERKQKGENVMSKLINELVGKECKIKSDDALELVGGTELSCVVLDCDDEWIKVQYTNKKNVQVVKLLRIENVDEVEILGEC